MVSEDNEPVVWTICSCSVSDLNFLYAWIGCCSASNNLKCMHLKEDKDKEDMKIKDLYEGSKRYLYLIKESIAGLILHVGLVHHKLVYTKCHHGFKRVPNFKPYFCSSHCHSSSGTIDSKRFCNRTSELKEWSETPMCVIGCAFDDTRVTLVQRRFYSGTCTKPFWY